MSVAAGVTPAAVRTALVGMLGAEGRPAHRTVGQGSERGVFGPGLLHRNEPTGRAPAEVGCGHAA